MHRRPLRRLLGEISYLAATPKLIGAERAQPQATFGKQTKAIVVTTGMLAFISFWRASADRPMRPRLLSLLHRRHRRAGLRPLRALLHSRRHAVLVRRARRLRRIVLDVHARRRLSRRQRSDGLDAGENLRLGPDVRLHPDRPHQRRFRRPIPGRLDQRAAQARALQHHSPARFHRRILRHRRYDLFLAPEHSRHRGIQWQGDAHHADHDRHGRAHDRMVRRDDLYARRASAAVRVEVHHRLAGMAQALSGRAHHRHFGHPHRVRPFDPRDVGRGIAGADQSRDRGAQA